MPKKQYEVSSHPSIPSMYTKFSTAVRIRILARLRKKSTEAEPKACFETRYVKGY